MKNWKCIIGATLLTPICIGVFVGLIVGWFWIMKMFPIIALTVVGLGILFYGFIIWTGLFDHCKKHWQKKKGKEGS